MPSDPRPKAIPYAAPPAAKAVAAAESASADYPEGASIGTPPAEGVWFALVTPGGNLAQSDGKPVRVP